VPQIEMQGVSPCSHWQSVTSPAGTSGPSRVRFMQTCMAQFVGRRGKLGHSEPRLVLDNSLTWGEAYDMQIMQFGEPTKV
jgi:hypothetical protein